MLKRSKSVPQHKNKSVPFVNIPLADGQVCFYFNIFNLINADSAPVIPKWDAAELKEKRLPKLCNV